jgi:hypothetical protein
VADVFTLDYVAYPGLLVTDLRRKFQVLDGSNSGRSMDAKMIRDILGRFFNYTITITNDGVHMDDYFKFYNTISNTNESHFLEAPYNDGTITQEIYVTAGEDKLTFLKGAYGFQQNQWDFITVNFIATSPFAGILP